MKGLWKRALRPRNLLKEALTEKRRMIQSERLNLEDYSSGSWGYKQAELNGYERAINEVVSLLED